ncbi:MAG: tetratricopeptide repeat protein [Fusobacteriaceae bacterium]
MLRTEILKNYCDKDPVLLTKKEEEMRINLLLKPNNIEFLKLLGDILYFKKDIAGAIKIYEKLIKKDNKKLDFIGFLGYLYYENENYNLAIEKIKEALLLNEKRAFLNFLLGNIYSRMGLIKEAIYNYDLAIFLDLDIYQAHLDFAKNYELMGCEKKAIKEYVAAYEIDPRKIEVLEKIDKLKKKTKNRNLG